MLAFCMIVPIHTEAGESGSNVLRKRKCTDITFWGTVGLAELNGMTEFMPETSCHGHV